MFGPEHYVPILKAKQAEFRALGRLAEEVRGGLTPLIELEPLGADGGYPIDKLTRDLAAGWAAPGAEPRALFLDPLDAGIAGALTALISRTRTLAVPTVPVTSPGRPGAYHREVATAHRTDGLGASIRLRERDFSGGPGALAAAVDGVLHQIDLAPPQVDLVIDLGAVFDAGVDAIAARSLAYLSETAHADDWRSLTVAAGAFPQNLEPGRHVYPRSDWLAWLRVRAAGLRRVPAFGDYAVQGPRSGLGPAFRGAPNLRYAHSDLWICHRGRGGAAMDNQEFRALCAELIRGRELLRDCWADGRIELVAGGADGPGSGEMWRRLAFCHHMTLTVSQVRAPHQ